MKKITFLLAFFCFCQTYAQVVNQSAGLRNVSWTIAKSHSTNSFAFKANPTTTANAAFDNRVFGGGGCLNGSLYPEATYSASICDGTTVNLVAPDSYAGEYSNINVFDTSDYVFSSSNASDYITVASADGRTALAIGVGSVNYSPAADGVVRVYFHTDGSCGGDEIPREKRVVCTTAVTVPECASNPSPANGSTTVPAFATFDVSWDAPTTGDPATSYDVYSGLSSNSLNFEGNFTTTTITGVGPLGENFTLYWKVVSRNLAGAAIGCAEWSFTTGPEPTAAPECASNPSPANGSTVPAFATFDLSWDAPTSGELATSYDVYAGPDSDNLVFEGNYTTTTIQNVGPIGTYSATIYWQIIPRNAAGLAIGCAIWSFTTGPEPTAAPECASNPSPANGGTIRALAFFDLSWNAPATDAAATSYDVYFGYTSDNLSMISENFQETTYRIQIYPPYNTPYYWKIVPKNAAGSAIGCSIWSFTSGSEPTAAPECASNPSPANGSITVPAFAAFDLSWDESTTGEYASVYDVYTGRNAGSLSLIGTYSHEITTIPNYGPINDYNTTIYWKVVPRNSIGAPIGCAEWSFTTGPEPTAAPECASNPSPADGSITVPAFDTFDVSWLPPAIGEFASSYDVFTGTSSSSLVLYGNYTGPGIPDFGPIRDYNTTIYWKVVPKNAAGDALDCTTWSFTTEPQPEGSPECASNPSPADGSTVNAFATFDLSWNPPAGEPATSYDVYFGESIDSLTYDDNFTTTTLTNFGFYGYFDTTLYWKVVPKNAAGAAIGCSIWSIATGPQTTDTPDYVNLQYPPTITVTRGGSGTVYGQVYEGGLTDVAPNVNGQAPGIVAWVAISPLGENTDPSTWDPYDWVQATWNAGSTGNNDEYQATIGANLLPGTYYYATRFSLNNGPFVYGGYSPSGGSFWDGATYVNGVLTVTEAPVPGNDDCDGATALVVDDTYCNGTNTNGTNAGATDSGVAVPLCFNYGLNDVWYSFEAPINTTMVDVSTDFLGGTLYDTEVALYEGACGSLTEIACDQDGGIVTQPTGYSYNSLISDAPVTAGETYYVRVAGYTDYDFGSFCLKVSRKQELSNQDFNNANLIHYPNPVKNILNLSYNQEISNVEVYNMLGQKVSATVIKANDAHIDMSNLSKGAYMVRVTSNDQVKTIKVIKE